MFETDSIAGVSTTPNPSWRMPTETLGTGGSVRCMEGTVQEELSATPIAPDGGYQRASAALT